jgi:hypothetical protein
MRRVRTGARGRKLGNILRSGGYRRLGTVKNGWDWRIERIERIERTVSLTDRPLSKFRPLQNAPLQTF